MDATTALSEKATLDRFNRSQDRLARDFGYGDTKGALGITQDCIEALTIFIASRINHLPEMAEADAEKQMLRVARNLPPEVIALAALNGALASIAHEDKVIRTRQALGRALEGECWAAGLLAADKGLAQRIEKAVRNRHGNLKYRQQASRSIAARAGYRVKFWEPKQLLTAGNLLLGYLLDALPHIFVRENAGKRNEFLTITEGALELAEQAVERGLRAHPVFLPGLTPPTPWTGWSSGGYWTDRSRLRVTLVRTGHKETAGAIRAALRDGTMQPHLGALNTLQGVPWAINGRVLEVLKWAYEAGIGVKGLPPKKALPAPEKPDAWALMDEQSRRSWKHKASQVKEYNRSYISDRVLLAQDLGTAERLLEAGLFWTPMNCDWRGRVYSISHFNFQRDDRVRGLFLFADGQPIGEEGLKWLKVHVANVGDFPAIPGGTDKISKRPIEERVQWTDTNTELIRSVATAPTLNLAWTKADKPFLFLAACMELAASLGSSSPAGWVTRLPVSFDGSCSGLQHLCAMTRAAEGSLVNLTASTQPQDVYQRVADAVTAKLETASAEGNALAKMWLAHGITRTVVKRNVMTYSYSSKKFGMAQQLIEDLMRPLAFDLLSGTIGQHPFGEDGRAAARYLASLTYDAIEELVHLPAQAMTMLQRCARALAHEGKPVAWTTPLGLPWINRYHVPKLQRLHLWLHDARVQMTYADGHEKEIDKEKASNGVAPNFVHALDATHLLMVARAAAAEGIVFLATVHDSFGCLAPQAARFRQIIREQFVELYEQNDVLTQVLDQCKRDLTVHNQQRLPEVPAYGPLDLQEVLNADFAFA